MRIIPRPDTGSETLIVIHKINNIYMYNIIFYIVTVSLVTKKF